MSEIYYDLFSSIITIAIALIALVYSIKSFKQSHKINNENILYQEKITAYRAIIYCLSNLLNYMELYLDCIESKLNSGRLSEKDKGVINGYDSDLWDKIYSFDNQVKSHSAILPNKVLNKLEDLTFDVFNLKSLTELEKHDFTNHEKSIDDLYKQADLLVNIFRKDLNTKALNENLFKRIAQKGKDK